MSVAKGEVQMEPTKDVEDNRESIYDKHFS